MPPTLSLSQCLCARSSHILSELFQSSIHISTGHLVSICPMVQGGVLGARGVCARKQPRFHPWETVWEGTQTLIHRNTHATTANSGTKRRTLSSPYHYHHSPSPSSECGRQGLKHLTHELVSFLLDPCEVGQSPPPFYYHWGK